MTLNEAMLVTRIVNAVKAQLTPSLLKPIYRAANASNPMFGHCYVATEAAYYLGAGALKFKPKRGKDASGIVHWWLENPFTGERLDVTVAQYTDFGKRPPYEAGVFGGFLTKQPSKRAQVVIEAAKKLF